MSEINKIDSFKGKYASFSNYFNRKNLVEYKGLKFTNTEAAFQCQKTYDASIQGLAQTMSPNDVKKAFGRAGLPGFPKFTLRTDWESVKYEVMHEVVKAKFEQNPDLKEILLNTGDAELIEGNTWHDNCWGDCHCPKCSSIKGTNWLGKVLMQVRSELRA
jgi:hypothetical protein